MAFLSVSFEAPNFNIDALKVSCAGQTLIIEAFCCHTAAPQKIIADVKSKATAVNASSESKAGPIAELVHFVVSTGIPHFALSFVTESVDEILSSAYELLAKYPFLGLESTELPAFTILNYDKSGF